MCGRCTLVAGDLMSINRADGVVWLRKRDLLEHNMEWVVTLNGQLHIGMTSASAVVKCSQGREDGRDPSSMRRIAALLGHNRIFDSKNVKDYSSMHRFIQQTWKAHILVAAIELASQEHSVEELSEVPVCSLKSLQKWIEDDPK